MSLLDAHSLSYVTVSCITAAMNPGPFFPKYVYDLAVSTSGLPIGDSEGLDLEVLFLDLILR